MDDEERTISDYVHAFWASEFVVFLGAASALAAEDPEDLEVIGGAAMALGFGGLGMWIGILGAGLYGLGVIDIRSLSIFGEVSGLVGSPTSTFIAPIGSVLNPHDPLELGKALGPISDLTFGLGTAKSVFDVTIASGTFLATYDQWKVDYDKAIHNYADIFVTADQRELDALDSSFRLEATLPILYGHDPLLPGGGELNSYEFGSLLNEGATLREGDRTTDSSVDDDFSISLP